MDYYEILGINSNANIQDIKNAYKKQAKLYHPDKLGEYKGNNIYRTKRSL